MSAFLSFSFFLRVKIFIIKDFTLALTLPGLFLFFFFFSHPDQYCQQCSDQYYSPSNPSPHTHTCTEVYDLIEDYSRCKTISRHKNYRTLILELSSGNTPTFTFCKAPPPTHCSIWIHKPSSTVSRVYQFNSVIHYFKYMDTESDIMWRRKKYLTQFYV